MKLVLADNLILVPRPDGLFHALIPGRDTVEVPCDCLPVLSGFATALSPDECYARLAEEYELDRDDFDAILVTLSKNGVLVEVGQASEEPDTDNVYDPTFYSKQWAVFSRDRMPPLVERYLDTEPGQRRAPVLDIGCGTGEQAMLLLDQGLDVVGVDISRGQIAKARKLAAGYVASGRARFELADARKLDLDSKDFGLATAMFGVVSHLPTKGELRDLCGSVSAHLQGDGIFAFDFWTADGLEQLQCSESSWQLGGCHSRTNSTFRTANGQVCAVLNLEGYRKAHDQWYRRWTMRVTLYPHDQDNVKQTLYECGFAEIAVFDAASMVISSPETSFLLVMAAKAPGTLPRDVLADGNAR